MYAITHIHLGTLSVDVAAATLTDVVAGIATNTWSIFGQ